MKRAIFLLAAILFAVSYWLVAPIIASLAPLQILGECYRWADYSACAEYALTIKTVGFVLLGTLYAGLLCWAARRW